MFEMYRCIIFFISFSIILSLTHWIEATNPYHGGVCKTSKGNVCINVYDCPFYANRLKNRKLHNYVIKEIRKNQCGFVRDNPAVCCPEMGSVIEMKINEEPVDEIILNLKHKNLHLLPTHDCGMTTMQFRVVHGDKASLGEYPWMALIVYAMSDGLEFLCGGTLISKRYILTAAHCVMPNIMGVRLGEYNMLSNKDCDDTKSKCAPAVQDLLIESIHVHSEYSNRTNHNDIALMRLSRDVDLSSEFVKPICLPLEDIPDVEGQLLTVVGWGLTETGGRSPILKKAILPQVSLDKCRKLYEQRDTIIEGQLCAGGQKEDSCNGDSGGPLSLMIPLGRFSREVQFGIVSYGLKNCGTEGYPGVYTRVNNYIQWILDTIRP